MRNFLKSIHSFTHSIGGLLVLILLCILYVSFDSYIYELHNFNLTAISALIYAILIVFAMLWSQVRNKVLLAHILAMIIFGNVISQFINNLSTGTFDFSNIRTYIQILTVIYLVFVISAECLFTNISSASFKLTEIYSIIALLAISYVFNGVGSMMVLAFPILVALLLGSKAVAFIVATAAAQRELIFNINLIVHSPNFADSWLNYVLVVLYAIIFVVLFINMFKKLKV